MYSKFKIHGNCYIDYVWSKSGALTDNELDALQSAGITDINWTPDTLMLANFNGDINAKPSDIENEVYKYLVQRREIGTNNIEDVAVTQWNQIRDWSCQSQKTYEYLITPIYIDDNLQETFGRRIITDTIVTDWDCVSIVDLIPSGEVGQYKVDEHSVWSFGANVEDITYTINNDVSYITTYSRFPREHRGKPCYLTASVRCLIGNIFSCDYTDDNIAKIEAFRKFCNNGKLKLFKDYKGNVVPCSIRANTDTSDSSTLAHQTTITFDIIQLIAREDVSAFSEVV